MYIVMISQSNFQVIEDKAEAQRVTEELAKTQKVYFFELKNVVETKLSWNKPSKSEKIKPSKEVPGIQESIDNNFDAGGVFVGPSKEVPVFRLPAYIVPNSPFNPLPIQDQSFDFYPKIRVCEESKDPELFTKLTEIFDTSKAILEESDNTQISITDYLDNLNNKDETIIIPAPAKSEIEIFDSEFEKALETNEKNESEITQTFEVQEVSNYQILEPVKESDITNEIVERKAIEDVKETTEIKANKIKKSSKKDSDNNEVVVVKDITPPAGEQKIYNTSLGVTIREDALKGACKNKFKNALELERTYKMYDSTIKNLNSLYPTIDNEDWFNALCNEYFISLPESEKQLKDSTEKLDILSVALDELEKVINASQLAELLKDSTEKLDILSVALDELEKVINASQLAELSKKYLGLTDEKYLNAFDKKVEEFNEKFFKQYLLELSNCNTELAINVLKRSSGYDGLQYSSLENQFKKATEEKLYFIRTNTDVSKLLEEFENKVYSCEDEREIYEIEKKYPVFKKVSEYLYNFKEEIIQSALKNCQVNKLIREIKDGNTLSVSTLLAQYPEDIRENTKVKIALAKAHGKKELMSI